MARTAVNLRENSMELGLMAMEQRKPISDQIADLASREVLFIDEMQTTSPNSPANGHRAPHQQQQQRHPKAGPTSRSNSSSQQTSPHGSTPNSPRPLGGEGPQPSTVLESSTEAEATNLRTVVQQTVQKFEKIAADAVGMSLNEISCGPSMLEPKAWAAITNQLDQRDQSSIAARLYETLYGLRGAISVGGGGGATLPGLPLAGHLGSGLDLFTPKTLNTNAYKGRRIPSAQLMPRGQEMPTRPKSTAELGSGIEEHSMGSSLASIPRASVLENGVCDKGEDEVGFTTINQKYTIVEMIGKGAFGKVHKALDGNGTEVAIKEMDCNLKAPKHRLGAAMQPKMARSASGSFAAKAMRRRSRCHSVVPDSLVMREVAIMKKLSHKNIVQLIEVIHDDEEDKVLLVMQYVDQGALGEVDNDGLCDTLEEEKLKSCIRQAATGLNYLHRHNVIHRDIKPENLLVSSAGACYLADFGVSAVVRDGNVVDFSAGTPTFFSPEMFRGQPEDVAKYGRESDIWALGVTLFALKFGELPFFKSNILDLARSVQEDPVSFPSSLEPDDPLRELLEGMLCKDPAKRMSLTSIRRHRYFGSAEMESDSINLPVEIGSAIPDVEITAEEVQHAISTTRRVTVCLPRMFGRASRNEAHRTPSHEDLIKFIPAEARRQSELPMVETTMGPTEAGSPVRFAKHRKQQQQQPPTGQPLSRSVKLVDGLDPTNAEGE